MYYPTRQIVRSVRVNFANIYLRHFFVTSIQFVACALRENLSNRASGVQVPRDICTRFGRYLSLYEVELDNNRQ